MSLINDALRRAGQHKKEQSPDPSGGVPMHPVHPPISSSNSFLGPILLVVIVLVVAVAGWFFWRGLQKNSRPVAVAKVQTPSVSDTKTTADVFAPSTTLKREAVIISEQVVEKAPAIQPNALAIEATEPKYIASNVAETVVASEPPAAPTAPDLKLQGIFYRINNPTALINGRTVSVGDKISGARIVNIARQEVTTEWNGQTNVLTMH